MFKPDSDRVNYSQILKPPSGYKVESAVGTTYSLDLATLVASSISLGLVEDTTQEILNNPICILSALQKISDKIVVFCEAGQIKMPKQASPLSILLDKMIVPVALEYDNKIKRFPAFHPKTWLVTYSNDQNERLYRFIVLSRNLTFDRSWDMAVTLDGFKTDVNKNPTKPIVDFLKFLYQQIQPGSSSDKKKELVKAVVEDVASVKFELDDKRFDGFQILPLGISNKYNINDEAMNWDTYHELLVISPFLTGSVIKSFNAEERGLTGAKRTLITRKAALSELQNGEADNFNIYTLKDSVVDGEEQISEEAREFRQQDVHTKLFLYRKYSYTDLYIGSMNASYAAFNSNVEMVLKLLTTNRYLNTEKLLLDLFGDGKHPEDNPFELADLSQVPVDTKDSELDVLETQIKKLCRVSRKACVKQDDNGYTLHVVFENLDVNDFANVTIAPLLGQCWQNLQQELIFNNLELLQLSELYKVRIIGSSGQCVERVIDIPTADLPTDRDRAVVNSVVKDKKTFMEYVSFVLSDDYLQYMLDTKSGFESGHVNTETNIMPGLYEKMLQTALKDRNKISDMSNLLNMVDNEEVVPKEFRDMCITFQKALNLK